MPSIKMNYEQCVNYFENIKPSNEAYNLHSIKTLLELIGNPQNHLKIIHIAGTNGKGSVSNLLNGVLLEEGYHVGLYNSPYILTPKETIFYNHLTIPEKSFSALACMIIDTCKEIVANGLSHPSSFECMTALAIKYFYDMGVDFAIIEVGLGGLNDATNVFDSPLLSIITSIDYDHTQFLGNTIEAITHAKAGIIKRGVPVVVAPNQNAVLDVIHQKASSLNAPVYLINWEEVIITMYEDSLSGMTFSMRNPYFDHSLLRTRFIGEHQLINISVALTSLHVLTHIQKIPISDTAIKEGIAKTYWSCRCEYIKTPQPMLIDGAHNASSMNRFIQVLNTYCKDVPITFLFGALSDKDIDSMLKQLATYSQTIFVTEPLSPRSMPQLQLVKLAKEYFKQVMSYESLDNTLNQALAYAKKHSTLLCCVGSLYLAIPVKNRISQIHLE